VSSHLLRLQFTHSPQHPANFLSSCPSIFQILARSNLGWYSLLLCQVESLFTPFKQPWGFPQTRIPDPMLR